MDNTQTILALISTFLGIVLVFLKIFEAWLKVSGPVKKFLSNRIVWLVIAVLIILGAVLIINPDKNNQENKEIIKVAIVTAHDNYVTALGADHDWRLIAGTDIQDSFEEFKLLCQSSGKIALQTWHKTDEGKNRYVTAMGADRDWIIMAQTATLDDYEEFEILDSETGDEQPCWKIINSLKEDGEIKVAFQTWHEKDGKKRLVTAMDASWDWKLRAETNELKASEIFTLILLSENS